MIENPPVSHPLLPPPPPPSPCRSSYYNSPVTVDIKYCTEMEPSVYEREVEISIFGSVFCRAKSLVVRRRFSLAKGDTGPGVLFLPLYIFLKMWRDGLHKGKLPQTRVCVCVKTDRQTDRSLFSQNNFVVVCM